MTRRHRLFQLLLMSFLAVAPLFLSGCTDDLADVCSGKYDHQTQSAISQLEQIQKKGLEGRSTASIETDRIESGHRSRFELVRLDESSRGQWQSWSEKELKRVEGYLDWTNLHREESVTGEKIRFRLKDAANQLVAFHGYSQEGRLSRMLETLRALEADRVEVQAYACRSR